MKKVSLVLMNEGRKESLKELRKAGLLHLESLEGKGQAFQNFKETYSLCEKALAILEEIKIPKKELSKAAKLKDDECSQKAQEIISLSDKKKSLFDLINQDLQELERVKLWGKVNPKDFEDLAEKGIYLYMYEIPEDKYKNIPEEFNTILVNKSGKIARFLLQTSQSLSSKPEGLPPEAYLLPMTKASTDEINEEIRKSKQEILRIDRRLADSKKFSSSIKDHQLKLVKDIEFERVYSGMEHEENSEENKKSELAWVTGYIPVDSLKKFEDLCKKNQWAFAASDPEDDDEAVPTKLKNNKFVSLIYPLTDFLDVTPGYREFDISAWFLFFFCIFFGMIFGDGGYGAIITALAIFMIFKGLISKKKASPLSGLVLLLGLSTMIYGALTCSWFGIENEKLPSFLVDISLAPISKAKVGEDLANTNQKIFCFILALLQLSIAHIKCAINDRKSLKCLGDIGALLELWGMFYVVMSLVVDSVKFPLFASDTAFIWVGGKIPLQYIALGTLLFGFVLNFIFSNYEGSIGKSILESLKNIISVLLGVVNVFSDIVSYIRLWAVALAGAAISSTVNSMAGPMMGKAIMFALAILLLVFGHGLNNILNLLSVIVHGVRLNTLEFSQHLGMSWSGTKYRPFSED